MITEDYCSYEVAKLLKEKGFNESCTAVYEEEVLRINTLCDYHNSELSSYICAPTHQMAMKWLREEHNIGIFPSTYTHIVDRKTIHSYGTAIINLKTYELMTDNYLSNDTYEDAVETAIKYCLENVI